MPVGTAGFPSATNVYIPSFLGSATDATAGMIIGFSRNVSQFPVMNYLQLVPTPTMQAMYLQLTAEQGARIISPDAAEYEWPDGDPAPTGIGENESFQAVPFITQRYGYPFTIGNLTRSQAAWDIVSQETAIIAQKAMTARTLLSQLALSTTSWSTHTSATATAIKSGVTGPWNTGGTGASGQNGPYIKQSLAAMSALINTDTLGVVQPKQMCLVVNPNTAWQMAGSTELVDQLKQSQYALPNITFKDGAMTDQWGLPPTLYGHPVIVEDAVVVTTRKGTTATKKYILADGVAYLVSRVGGIQGVFGGKSFSTLQMFYHQDEMTVQLFTDQYNERTTGRVVSNYKVLVTSYLTGYYVANVFA